MLLSSVRFVSSVAGFTLALGMCAQADEGVRLTTAAAQNGFTYQWMPTEAGAMLARPGLRIIIRAGRLFYEVNNATPVADIAPTFDGRDLVISHKLATHLRALALEYPQGASDVPGSLTVDEAGSRTHRAGRAGMLTLQARQIPGRESIALSGTGPAGVALTITLTGEMSTDLPIVVLSRKTVTTATDGSFSAEVYYSQDSHPKTTVVATVTSLSGVSPADARVVIGVPSAQITSSGLDDWPKK